MPDKYVLCAQLWYCVVWKNGKGEGLYVFSANPPTAGLTGHHTLAAAPHFPMFSLWFVGLVDVNLQLWRPTVPGVIRYGLFGVWFLALSVVSS